VTPEEYCRQKTAAAGSHLALSFLFLDPETRRAAEALYAFCREVDDVVDRPGEPSVARLKLHWWREELARAYAGRAQHPVTRALQGILPRYDLPQEHFQELIDGMEMDLDMDQHGRRYATWRELGLYCYRAASVVGLLSAEIFGYEDRRTLRYAHHLGTAFQLTNILRDVGEDRRRGRVYLPQEAMAAHGVSEAELAAPRTGPALRALLAELAGRAEDHYRIALESLPEGDRYRQRAGLVMAAVYRELLAAIARAGYDVLGRRIRVPPLRRLWVAWRAARREERLERRRRRAP